MNKLVMFPLAFMFLLTIIVTMITAVQVNGSTDDMSTPDGSIVINDPNEDYRTNGSVSVPRAGSQTFDIWTENGIMVIMVVAIAIGIVAGITVVGSGLSGSAQSMIFTSVFFLGLWACLTIVSRNIMFDNMVTNIMWFGLTMTYVVGLATDMNGSSD